MKNVLVYPLSLLLLFSVSCKNNSAKTPQDLIKEASKSSTLYVKGKDFTVAIPEGWTSRDTTMQGITFYFLNAPATKDNLNTSMNIIHESMRSLSLDDYIDGSIQSMKKQLPDFTVLEKGTIDASGVKGIWFRYNMSLSGVKYDLINYTFPSENIAYILTGGTKPGYMDKFKSTFDEVAQSFRLAK